MAQKVQVLLVDDIDGGTADETVTFGLDGVTYEIDLTSGHASELRDAFAQWVGHARKVGGRTAAKSGSYGRFSWGGTCFPVTRDGFRPLGWSKVWKSRYAGSPG